MGVGLSEVTLGLERRIAEIDRQLAAMDALREEREHLARALAEVAAAKRPPATPKSQRRRGSTSRRGVSRRPARAPEGANDERIVAFLREHGATSASAIAKGTGINRAVVYRSLGKLAGRSSVVKQDGEGGTAVFAAAV